MLTTYLPDSARLMADSLIRRTGLLTRVWTYENGVVWRGLEAVWRLTGDRRYLDQIREALETFIRNLSEVVERAEHWGVSMAIEPVWNHIVYNADRAVEVLKAIQSPNLRIILDPVNLLCMENADDREAIFQDAMEKLCDHIAVVHLKDFVRRDGKLISVAAGTGEMQYESILRFVKERKPFIQATLENTTNENAIAAREFIQRVYDEI